MGISNKVNSIAIKHTIIISIILCSLRINAQEFYYGNDLSYVNMMEDCGAIFKENGKPKDVYQIFADHGTNLVRVRLWYNPTWQNGIPQPDGVKNQYNDFDDAKETLKRAKEAGMKTMLGIHYSDVWADPGRQVVPSKWAAIASNVDILSDSVYNYTTKVLNDLNKEGLLPDIVKVGNENNGGIMRHSGMDNNLDPTGTLSSSWNRHAKLYKSAFKAIRDYTDTTSTKPKIAVHFADLKHIAWGISELVNNDATDFDIIGFTYYFSWHGASISALGKKVKDLKSTYPDYDVMAVETGYLWSIQNFDQMGNIINTADQNYLPVSPEKQLEYMVDYAKAVKKNGGIGVVFWEPAWVSTPCRNPWGKGSSQEHVAFFEVDSYNFMENGGGRWMESQFYENEDNVVVTFKVNMSGQDVSNGVYISGSFTGTDNRKILPMYNSSGTTYTYTTAMMPGDTGVYYFLNDSSWEARENLSTECELAGGENRKYTIGNSHTIILNTWEQCDMVSIDSRFKNDSDDLVEFYPIPTNNYLFIKTPETTPIVSVALYASSGDLLLQNTISGNSNQTSLNTSHLSEGIYFVAVKHGSRNTLKKIVLK